MYIFGDFVSHWNQINFLETTLFSLPLRSMMLEYINPRKGIVKEQRNKLLRLVDIENESAMVSLMETILQCVYPPPPPTDWRRCHAGQTA
jgi:hypothetical protein